jgi:hypothetical protein
LKKIIAILFLSFYLLSSTELHQLLKVPFLVEHFMEHKEQNKDLTLWQFLCLHYSDNNKKDADYEKDMKLPFKSHDCCSGSFVAYFTVQSIPLFQEHSKPLYYEAQSFTLYQEVFFNTSFLDSIWQPPKSC